MGSRLKDNINSGYFEAANSMTSKRAKRRIVAYVESYDDVYFWRTVLRRFENDKLYFEVMLPSKRNLSKGKKSVMMNVIGNNVGPNMIACVDADYDYLLQGASPQSRTVLENKYVFHTYVYAIENYQCYAPSLHDVCVSITLNDRPIFDFVDFFTRFSEYIYPLFVWNILLYRKNKYNEFTMTDFNNVVELGRFSLGGYEDTLKNIKRRTEKKVNQLRSRYQYMLSDYDKLYKELPSLGVTPQTTYLFIQGHHLFEDIVVTMVKKVCEKLERQRENEIYRNAVHNTQKNNELSCYRHSKQDVITMLKRNTQYVDCEQFKTLQEDINAYISHS